MGGREGKVGGPDLFKVAEWRSGTYLLWLSGINLEAGVC